MTRPLAIIFASMISARHDRHDQQVLDGALLALADQRRTGQDHGQAA